MALSRYGDDGSETDPYTDQPAPPPLPLSGTGDQQSRLRDIRVSQVVLIIVGALTIGMTAIATADLSLQLKLSQWSDWMLFALLLNGGIGVLYVVFGCVLRKAPATLTKIALAIYLVDTILALLLRPALLFELAMLIRLVVIVVLTKAAVSATEYERGVAAGDKEITMLSD